VQTGVPQGEDLALAWQDEAARAKSITRLYEFAVAKADNAIRWYFREKGGKSRWSQWLRALAILLTTLAGLVPIFQSSGVTNPFPMKSGSLQLLLIGLVGACLGLDRYFGFSRGWMRYITTGQVLQRALSEFHFDWAMISAKAGAAGLTPEIAQELLQRLKSLVTTIESTVEKETSDWIADFQANLADLEQKVKAQAEAVRPGNVELTVPNGDKTENGFDVTVDGLPVGHSRGTSHQIRFLVPGEHQVVVRGIVAGKPVEASGSTMVTAGGSVKLTLSLA
jgi:SMODS and SLOG-associating 2TM effector domain 2